MLAILFTNQLTSKGALDKTRHQVPTHFIGIQASRKMLGSRETLLIALTKLLKEVKVVVSSVAFCEIEGEIIDIFIF